MWSLFNRSFRGDIKRLVIVAAPSGAGKTTFLNDPATMLDAKLLPPELADFHEIAAQHWRLRALREIRDGNFENLCLHVDISRPIRRLNRLAANREKLSAQLTAKIFKDCRALSGFTQRAGEVHVVTMFVRREPHYRRWIERTRERNQKVHKLSAARNLINSDPTNRSELHRKLYGAWREYVASLGTNSVHILDANSEQYSFMSQAEFDGEIDFGYPESETNLNSRTELDHEIDVGFEECNEKRTQALELINTHAN